MGTIHRLCLTLKKSDNQLFSLHVSHAATCATPSHCEPAHVLDRKSCLPANASLQTCTLFVPASFCHPATCRYFSMEKSQGAAAIFVFVFLKTHWDISLLSLLITAHQSLRPKLFFFCSGAERCVQVHVNPCSPLEQRVASTLRRLIPLNCL